MWNPDLTQNRPARVSIYVKKYTSSIVSITKYDNRKTFESQNTYLNKTKKMLTKNNLKF